MCLPRVWWAQLWLILLWILCLLRAPFTGANEAVRCERVPAAVLGEDVTLKCNFTLSLDVLQVTWQKLEGSSFKNIATYSKAHGTKSIGPFNKRVCFNDTSLKASSITFRGVILEDETCYKCIFNAFPHGSFSRETCLIVQSANPRKFSVQKKTVFKIKEESKRYTGTQINIFRRKRKERGRQSESFIYGRD